MSLQGIKKRLERVSGDMSGNISPELLEALKSEARYCDLSDNLKDEYCQYRGFEREAFEDIERMILAHDINGNRMIEPEQAKRIRISTTIQFKPKPPTMAERLETIRIIEEMIRDGEEKLIAEANRQK